MPAKQEQRTALIGILVDVSASMAGAIGLESGSASRLDSVRQAIRDLSALLSKGQADALRDVGVSIDIFALGFGFNPFSRSAVRDLLLQAGASDLSVTATDVSRNWEGHEGSIRDLAIYMFGATPLCAALEEASVRFQALMPRQSYRHGCWLLIVSDGAPTDGGPDDVAKLAKQLHDAGINVISCFVAGTDVVSHRRLFAAAEQAWSSEARMMFNVSSPIPPNSPLVRYFKEELRLAWGVDEGARLFTQANNSELITEFFGLLGKVTGKTNPAAETPRTAEAGERGPVSTFISYAREDEPMANELASLLGGHGIDVWWDNELAAGAPFPAGIQEAIERADSAVVIWTANSVDSDWVRWEADCAHAKEKLVPIRADDLDPRRIPPPYTAAMHIAPWSERAKLPGWLKARKKDRR